MVLGFLLICVPFAHRISLFFRLQQILETCEGFKSSRFFFLVTHFRTTPFGMIKKSAVFIVMAIEAEIFPVAAIGGVVVMVVVSMVHGQQMQVLTSKFAPATGTNPGVDFERSLAVTFSRSCHDLRAAETIRSMLSLPD
jgi:hypothetical protein